MDENNNRLPPDYPPPGSASQYPQAHDGREDSMANPAADYGMQPASARSSTFPDAAHRGYQLPGSQPPHPAALAQPTSPATQPPLSAGLVHPLHNPQPTGAVPGDHALASPTVPQPPYATHQYHQGHEMPTYAHQVAYPRAPHDWASPYAQPHHVTGYAHPTAPGHPGAMVAPTAHPPMSTVYSFVPIPGAQQHKRPRRRYEEIERMYKCGYNGCEKAYGTLNHLNAHVTMQGHGSKRTPEEFKEIRKEWKLRKKQEAEAARRDDTNGTRMPEGNSGSEGTGEYGHQMNNSTASTASASAQSPLSPGQLPPPMGYSPSSTNPHQQSYSQHTAVDSVPNHYGGAAAAPVYNGTSPYAQGEMQNPTAYQSPPQPSHAQSQPPTPYGGQPPDYRQDPQSGSPYHQNQRR